MKKIRLSIAALMTAFLILSVTACGSASDSGTETTSGSRQTTTAEDTRSSGENQRETTHRDGDDGGIIDDVMDDVRDGAEDVKNEMEDMTEETRKD